MVRGRWRRWGVDARLGERTGLYVQGWRQGVCVCLEWVLQGVSMASGPGNWTIVYKCDWKVLLGTKKKLKLYLCDELCPFEKL